MLAIASKSCFTSNNAITPKSSHQAAINTVKQKPFLETSQTDGPLFGVFTVPTREPQDSWAVSAIQGGL